MRSTWEHKTSKRHYFSTAEVLDKLGIEIADGETASIDWQNDPHRPASERELIVEITTYEEGGDPKPESAPAPRPWQRKR